MMMMMMNTSNATTKAAGTGHAPSRSGDAAASDSPDHQTQTNVIGSENDHHYKDSRILIVDDNPQNVELLEAYLAALPCEVSSVSDGLAAITAVEANPPDLILLDVMMPRMSGFEVCQRLKNDPATSDVLILMVTALNEVGDVERGAEAGTDDFLSKPFNKIELLTRVRSLLRIRHLKKELDRTIARTAGAGGESQPNPRSTTSSAGDPDIDEETSPGG